MMTGKTEKTNIPVYAVKGDDDPRPNPTSWVYALKSDDGSKPKNRISLAYAFIGDDGKMKNKHW